MCVVSMVSDHYSKRWPFNDDNTALPLGGIQGSPWQQIPASDLDSLRQILKEFREAMDAAKKVDKLTAQPDCEDAGKKQALEDRVAELERRLDAMDKPKRRRARN